MGWAAGVKTVIQADSGLELPAKHSFFKKTQNNRLTSSAGSCLIGAQQPKTLI
jgi:hypothetical protein